MVKRAIHADQFFPPPRRPPLPPDEDPDSPRFWREWEGAVHPPANELGRELPIRVRLYRGDHSALWLLSFVVYSTGFVIRIGGFTEGGISSEQPQIDRLGVAFSDGQTATSRDRINSDEPPREPTLRRLQRSSARSGRSAEVYWVFGLPPAGKLWLHYACSDDRSRRRIFELDAEPIRQLAL